MGARIRLVGALTIGALAASDAVHAQDADKTQALPDVTITAPPPAGAKPARNRDTTRTARTLRRIPIYPTAPTPTASTGIDVDKVPAAINAVGANQIARTDSLNIADALQQQIPGIIISDTTGNPFQPDVQFRGFVASPLPGTPQGLAVYQNGVRVNEAFGDTVNWDLIPTAAIRSVTVVTNNPAFGLNASPLSVEFVQDVNIITGGGSQTQNLTRWGDYSALTIDPVDDCTFWYVNQYLKTNGSFNWSTRVASFKFPTCQ